MTQKKTRPSNNDKAGNNLFGDLSTEDFTARYWQKEPLLVRNALPSVAGLIDGNDLAGIACEAEAEARLILCNEEQSCDVQQKDWQCEQGPFKAKRFKTLPVSHWTLLVQSVDQWIPEIGALLQHFSFLPRWRLDDIMVSYATNGGGVGPHFDYYDVFLLQAAGTRQWQVGQRCDEHSPLREHADLKLLQQFDSKATHELHTGDMLYLPAGVAHWGTAVGDDCITISIGFRAASHREILQVALDTLAETLPANQRYRDTEEAIDTDPFCINNAVSDNLVAMWRAMDESSVRHALTQALGELATEPRYPDQIAAEKPLTPQQLNSTLAKKKILEIAHHPGSRFAYHALSDTRAELYADGGVLNTTLALAQGICREKIPADVLESTEEKTLLLALINRGCVQIQP